MKTNNNTVGGSLSTNMYAAYATYLDSFCNAAPIDYISLQNEPNIAPSYEGCEWTGAQLQTFCHNNAGAIVKPVIMPESMNFDFSYSDPDA